MKQEETEEITWTEIIQGLAYVVALCFIGITFAVSLLVFVSHLYYQYQAEHLI